MKHCDPQISKSNSLLHQRLCTLFKARLIRYSMLFIFALFISVLCSCFSPIRSSNFIVVANCSDVALLKRVAKESKDVNSRFVASVKLNDVELVKKTIEYVANNYKVGWKYDFSNEVLLYMLESTIEESTDLNAKEPYLEIPRRIHDDSKNMYTYITYKNIGITDSMKQAIADSYILHYSKFNRRSMYQSSQDKLLAHRFTLLPDSLSYLKPFYEEISKESGITSSTLDIMAYLKYSESIGNFDNEANSLQAIKNAIAYQEGFKHAPENHFYVSKYTQPTDRAPLAVTNAFISLNSKDFKKHFPDVYAIVGVDTWALKYVRKGTLSQVSMWGYRYNILLFNKGSLLAQRWFEDEAPAEAVVPLHGYSYYSPKPKINILDFSPLLKITRDETIYDSISMSTTNKDLLLGLIPLVSQRRLYDILMENKYPEETKYSARLFDKDSVLAAKLAIKQKAHRSIAIENISDFKIIKNVYEEEVPYSTTIGSLIIAYLNYLPWRPFQEVSEPEQIRRREKFYAKAKEKYLLVNCKDETCYSPAEIISILNDEVRGFYQNMSPSDVEYAYMSKIVNIIASYDVKSLFTYEFDKFYTESYKIAYRYYVQKLSFSYLSRDEAYNMITDSNLKPYIKEFLESDAGIESINIKMHDQEMLYNIVESSDLSVHCRLGLMGYIFNKDILSMIAKQNSDKLTQFLAEKLLRDAIVFEDVRNINVDLENRRLMSEPVTVADQLINETIWKVLVNRTEDYNELLKMANEIKIEKNTSSHPRLGHIYSRMKANGQLGTYLLMEKSKAKHKFASQFIWRD